MSPQLTGTPVGPPTPGPELPGLFARYKDLVEAGLSRSVPESNGYGLFSMLRYHLGWENQHGVPTESSTTQGKSLRPTLCMFACEALAVDPARALPAAAAMELIHNFSLIHDDIQDQDVERRHQPTLWSLWGIPKALVAGDALQSVGDLAVSGLAGSNEMGGDVPAQTALRVSQILTESYMEMIQGQCLDLDFESRTDIASAEYLQMIAYKTGALIRSSLEIGALLATGDPVAFDAFSRFGAAVGRAFQIRDDFLGIWGDQATTGKAAGNDIWRRKKTFPVVFALENATGESRKELLRIYRQDELTGDEVQTVLAILEEVGARQQTHAVTEASANKALEALQPVSLPAWAQNEAASLVGFLAHRDY
jgi:geranylgeranyl diphosphate synthase type I